MKKRRNNNVDLFSVQSWILLRIMKSAWMVITILTAVFMGEYNRKLSPRKLDPNTFASMDVSIVEKVKESMNLYLKKLKKKFRRIFYIFFPAVKFAIWCGFERNKNENRNRPSWVGKCIYQNRSIRSHHELSLLKQFLGHSFWESTTENKLSPPIDHTPNERFRNRWMME